MQVRPAHKRMDRAHAENTYQTASAGSPDEFVAAVALPPRQSEEILRAQVRAQLDDDRKGRGPFARLQATDLQTVHAQMHPSLPDQSGK